MSRSFLASTSAGCLGWLLVSTACTTTTKVVPAAQAEPAANEPCACVGVAVNEGSVDAACGASVCLGRTGYRCSEDGQSAVSDPDACPHNDSGGSGGKTGLALKSLDDEGTDRRYAVNVPTSYTGERGVPLLLHFHGWRPAPAGVKEEIELLWKPTGDKEGFIAVAPEGAPCPELNPNGAPFLCFDEQRDDAWLQKLIETIEGLYNVDRDRVFLSGHSGGSFFVQGYGVLHASQFRAAATFAGGCISASDEYGNSCAVYEKMTKTAKRKVPYFLIHNPGDKVVPQSYSIAMQKVFDAAGFKTKTHFKAYDAGSNGHSIDPDLIPEVWSWIRDADSDFVAEQ